MNPSDAFGFVEDLAAQWTEMGMAVQAQLDLTHPRVYATSGGVHVSAVTTAGRRGNVHVNVGGTTGCYEPGQMHPTTSP